MMTTADLRLIDPLLTPVAERVLVGGLHPKLRADYYEELFQALKERFPWIHIKALTMIELNFIATASRMELGEKIAQVALNFGANDLDGTVVDERITYAAGGTAGTGLDRRRLECLIREAGRTPVLRDTLYRPLDSSFAAPASSVAAGASAS